MKLKLEGKRILVTGACGTVGRELVNQLLTNYEVEELIALDNNESELFFLEQIHRSKNNARFELADIKELSTISELMRGADIVFHAAAFKHVVLCERGPDQAVANNIIGVQNIIHAARANKVELVVFTSSDKAVNPTSVMGTSKLMGEKLITAANSSAREGDPVFVSSRFGNVLGSRGSVIPIFKEQIARGGPVTITHPEMTRFIMSVYDAVRLMLDSVSFACGGEVLVTKMPVTKIKHLAEVMIEELAPGYGISANEIDLVEIGYKPGEKLYEELMSSEESRRAIELDDYFVILPAFKSLYKEILYEYESVVKEEITLPYNSQNEKPLDKASLKAFLHSHNLLSEDVVFKPSERFWPEKSN